MVRLFVAVSAAIVALATPAQADTLPMVNSWGGAGQATGRFVNLVDVAAGPDGSIYTIENGGGVADRVQHFDANGTFLGAGGSEGNAPGQLQQPWSVAVGGDRIVYALDTFLDRVTRFSADLTTVLGTWGSSGFGPGQFRNPEGINVFGADTVWIADRANNEIDRYTATGTQVTEFSGPGDANNQLNRPIEITTDRGGDVYVADRDHQLVKRFTAAGAYVRSYGLGQGTGPGQLNSPNDVAVDSAGNVWISDITNFNVQEFANDGDFIASYNRVGTGAGQTFRPEGLSFGPGGDLYIADASGSRIIRARPGGAQGGGGALPPPAAGKTANASVVSGTVLVKLPGTGAFVKLTDATAIPVGSQLDTRRGTLKLTAALRSTGATASAQLSGGRFLFGQKTGSGKLRTDLSLKGGSFKGCPAPGKGGSARRRTIRYLTAKATGKFNVIGRHSSGVERGTTWTTKDTCTTTTTSVKAGSVAVRDFARRKTIIVRAGKTYVARAKRR